MKSDDERGAEAKTDAAMDRLLESVGGGGGGGGCLSTIVGGLVVVGFMLAALFLPGCAPESCRRDEVPLPTCSEACECWPARQQQARCVVGCVVAGGWAQCPNGVEVEAE